MEREKEPSVPAAWKSAWSSAGFRRVVWVAFIAAVPLAAVLPMFFAYIDGIMGRVPPDPLIPVIGPFDVTWFTFSVLYCAIIITVARALNRPWVIARGLHAYALLMGLRMITMRVLVLEAPADIIPLIDPVTQSFYPGATPFLKDLFFSGHTATLALMVCIAQGRLARRLTVLATAVVGALVIVQHVHWTVDVLAAPVFVWVAWKGAGLTVRLCAGEAV